jgi:hypothetical protein
MSPAPDGPRDYLVRAYLLVTDSIAHDIQTLADRVAKARQVEGSYIDAAIGTHQALLDAVVALNLGDLYGAARDIDLWDASHPEVTS